MDIDYSIVMPVMIIVIALLVIIIIIIRKFPDLALVDINSIPEERAKQLKDKLLADRLQRRSFGFIGRVFSFVKIFFDLIASFFRKIKKKIDDWESQYRHRYKPVVKSGDMKEQVKLLLEEANKQLDNDEYKDAERTFLEVINHEKHNINAYRGLGKLYYRQKEYQQSKEIFQFAIKLFLDKKGKAGFELEDSDIAQLYYQLALVFKAVEDDRKAMEQFKLSVEKEEKNPKYLDCLLEAAIKVEEKELAADTLEKLTVVNPNNSKLEDFKSQIEELAEKGRE